jgi:DNA-binding MarR family transcriptional regulator
VSTSDDDAKGSGREQVFGRVDLAGRESSAATVMFHTALAARRGLSATEEKTLDVLLRRGPLTHSDLVAELALAPPTVTDVLNRLEGRGYAHRSVHPDDRRRRLISVDSDRVAAELTPLFQDWVQRLHELYATYTDKQLALIADFLSRAASLQREAAEDLKD